MFSQSLNPVTVELGSPAVGEMITVEYTEHVAVVTMVHRPYNLSGPDLHRPLLDAFAAAVEVGSRAILLKSGLRHFCAGADVSLWDKRIANQGKAQIDPVEALRGFENLPIPIVAGVHGACLGGGLEIALACDLIVAAASAKLGSVEGRFGDPPAARGHSTPSPTHGRRPRQGNGDARPSLRCRDPRALGADQPRR